MEPRKPHRDRASHPDRGGDGARRSHGSLLRAHYRAAQRWHPIHSWWPGETPWAIAVTAVLTQNIRWENAWEAWLRLRERGLADPATLRQAPDPEIMEAIRRAGGFRRKTRTLKELACMVTERFSGHIERLSTLPIEQARELLLSIPGIGPETADSILLYACRMPVFVVDAYTRRILARHGLIHGREDYEAVRRWLERYVPRKVDVYHRFHAWFVLIGKTFCHRSRPRCIRCPWARFLPVVAATTGVHAPYTIKTDGEFDYGPPGTENA